LADSKKKNGTLGLKDKSTEVWELLDSMEREPLLRYELLVYFYKYKNKKKSREVEEIKDLEIRMLCSSNKRRASSPFLKRSINRAKSFSENYFRDFFQLL
jgi:hypothetical protein